MISSNVQHIVRTIKIVDHLNGRGIIVLGGSSEYVKVKRTLQWTILLLGLVEEKVIHFFIIHLYSIQSNMYIYKNL